jgi:hypothetical protein
VSSSVSTGYSKSLEYLLEPSFLRIHMQLSLYDNATLTTTNSLIGMEVAISNLSLRIGSPHIPHLQRIVDFMANRVLFDKYQYFRPSNDSVSINPHDPERIRALWRWAINCVYTDIRRKKYAFKWDAIRHYRDDRVCICVCVPYRFCCILYSGCIFFI